MSTNIDPARIKATIDFHGHWCPGLAIGIRAAEWALKEMGGRAEDEEIVTVVETDMCGVDAIQYLIGCTFGKGNLIHMDYGKNAFNFYRRRDDKAVRIVARTGIYGESQQTLGRLHGKMMTEGLTDDEYAEWQRIRAEISDHIMDSELDDLFEVKEPAGPVPKKARILASLVCETCGESVMESRTRRFHEKNMCIPCFKDMEKRM